MKTEMNRVYTVATDRNQHCGHVHRTLDGAKSCLAKLGRQYHLWVGDPRDENSSNWMGAKPHVRGYVD